MGSKIKTTGHIGENWGARLKLTRYEEHWQAQAMAMAMAGAGARFKLRGAMGNWGIALALHLWQAYYDMGNNYWSKIKTTGRNGELREQ